MIDLPRGKEYGPDEIATRTFPGARRGIDAEAVRRFLEEIANQIRRLNANEAELRERLVEVERRASSPELDEATLSAAVGTETGRVLQVAHEAAHEVVAKAEARAAELVSAGEAALRERTEAVEHRAEALIRNARETANTLAIQAKEECRAMVDEAREARRRILADLGVRRRSLHIQLEQLRAGKDALAKVVDDVALSISDVRSRIHGAEEEARTAADDVALEDSGELDSDLELADRVPVFEELPASQALEALLEGETVGEPILSAEGEPHGVSSEAKLPSAHVEPDQPVPEPPPTDQVEPRSTEQVDELFAKLRADSVVDEEPPSPATAEIEANDEPPVEAATDVAIESEEPAPPDPESESPTGDRRLLVSRDELVSTSASALARAMKRVLASEQNELLDAIRNLGPREDPLTLLRSDQARERIAEAATESLAQAFEAGATFAVAEIGLPRTVPAKAKAKATGERARSLAVDLAADLAGEILATVERRVNESADEGVSSEDFAGLVGVAFREWKGPRIELRSGDGAAKAFSLGVAEVARARKLAVRWVVDDRVTPCPDCDDNGLAGAQSVDESFPTGQHEPPVHPGCRCVLVPVSA